MFLQSFSKQCNKVVQSHLKVSSEELYQLRIVPKAFSTLTISTTYKKKNKYRPQSRYCQIKECFKESNLHNYAGVYDILEFQPCTSFASIEVSR